MGLLNNFIKILKKGELEQAKIQKNKLPQDDVTIGTSGITFKATDDKSIEALNQALKEEGYRGPGLNLSRIGEVLSEKMGQGMRTLDMEELLLAIQKDNEETKSGRERKIFFDYFIEITLLLSDLCFNRNYLAIDALKERFPLDMC